MTLFNIFFLNLMERGSTKLRVSTFDDLKPMKTVWLMNRNGYDGFNNKIGQRTLFINESKLLGRGVQNKNGNAVVIISLRVAFAEFLFYADGCRFEAFMGGKRRI